MSLSLSGSRIRREGEIIGCLYAKLTRVEYSSCARPSEASVSSSEGRTLILRIPWMGKCRAWEQSLRGLHMRPLPDFDSRLNCVS